jgi:hypothetical protein
VIAPFTDEWIDAVKAFNVRLRAGGISWQFYETPLSHWLPKLDGRKPYEEFYLWLGDGQVRGAYVYKRQDFLLGGQPTEVGYYRLPLSEGLVDKRFASVGVQMLLSALRSDPLLFNLGIGSYDETIVKMARAAGWATHTIPFFFRVNHPAVFLKNIVHLRRGRMRQIAFDVLAATGLGALLVGGYQAGKTRKNRRPLPKFRTAVQESFGGWADEVWRAGMLNYSMIAVRDAVNLNILYPAHSKVVRLKVEVDGETVGWAVVSNRKLDGHHYFGSMTLGALVDCLARPGHEAAVVASADEYLKQDGADLTVTNLSHRDWCSAARACGFLDGPSNFIFAASKKLAERLQPIEEQKHRLHLMRADGSGPRSVLGD